MTRAFSILPESLIKYAMPPLPNLFFFHIFCSVLLVLFLPLVSSFFTVLFLLLHFSLSFSLTICSSHSLPLSLHHHQLFLLWGFIVPILVASAMVGHHRNLSRMKQACLFICRNPPVVKLTSWSYQSLTPPLLLTILPDPFRHLMLRLMSSKKGAKCSILALLNCLLPITMRM